MHKEIYDIRMRPSIQTAVGNVARGDGIGRLGCGDQGDMGQMGMSLVNGCMGISFRLDIVCYGVVIVWSGGLV